MSHPASGDGLGGTGGGGTGLGGFGGAGGGGGPPLILAEFCIALLVRFIIAPNV